MTQITLKGNPVNTAGALPKVGEKAPNFKVTKTDLTDTTLDDYRGKRLVINIFPSIGTGVCKSSVRKFNQEAAALDNTVVLCVSRDLPFAHKQFCEAEGIANVVMTSEYKNNSFSDAYHVKMTSGSMEGLLSRSVVVVDEDGKIIYTEQVPEIGQEPDYESALAALK